MASYWVLNIIKPYSIKWNNNLDSISAVYKLKLDCQRSNDGVGGEQWVDSCLSGVVCIIVGPSVKDSISTPNVHGETAQTFILWENNSRGGIMSVDSQVGLDVVVGAIKFAGNGNRSHSHVSTPGHSTGAARVGCQTKILVP